MSSDSQVLVTAALVAALAIILAGFVSLLSVSLEHRRKSKALPVRAGKRSAPVQIANVAGIEMVEEEISIDSVDDHLSRRLNEARDSLVQLRWQVRLNGLVNGFLVFGQYVIGGILTTSFVQETLDKQAVGALGVLVLLATLLHQSYRPDIKARAAGAKSRYLRWLMRKAENDRIRFGSEKSLDIAEAVTQGLNKVDLEEEWEVEDTKKSAKAS